MINPILGPEPVMRFFKALQRSACTLEYARTLTADMRDGIFEVDAEKEGASFEDNISAKKIIIEEMWRGSSATQLAGADLLGS